MSAHIAIDREQIAAFCRKHHIRKLSLFGSVLRDDFRPDSDVDVLVEFEPGHVPGFIRLHGIEEELAPLLGGRRLDLVTAKFLNPRIRDRVLTEAEVQYAEGTQDLAPLIAALEPLLPPDSPQP
jgi:predicted nucleotidyltransferase